MNISAKYLKVMPLLLVIGAIVFIKNDQTMLEREPLEHLTKKGQLMAFKHYGFWQCMDTLREKNLLNEIYKNKKQKTPWIK